MEQFREAKVLVTGASGFIGGRLVRTLVTCGAQVYGISRYALIPELEAERRIQGDLSDRAFVLQAVKTLKPDFIYHLSSMVTGSRDVTMVNPVLMANLVATTNLLEAASVNGARKVVIAGSLEEPDADDGNAVPCSPYAAAKWAASGYARMFAELYQLPVSIAKLFMVYGPGQKDLKKFVPYVILSLLQSHVPKLASGTRPVDWIFVDDVVHGLLLMGQVSDLDGKTVELGSGALHTTRDIALQITRLIGDGVAPEFGAIPDRPLERIRQADVAQTQQLLGWSPSRDIATGLQQTIDWYRNGLQKGEFSLTE